MNDLILTINPGSSSVKFALFRLEQGINIELTKGVIAGLGSNTSFTITNSGRFGREFTKPINNSLKQVTSVEEACKLIIACLTSNLRLHQIKLICYRVVHGGNYFSTPVEINTAVLQKLASLVPLAPIHQPAGLSAIRIFMREFSEARHIACFDTAFHHTMPKVAQTFALPERLRAKEIKPYGFHGLSYQFISGKLAQLNQGKIPRRVVIAHLGGGASLCALERGKSIATSMSFSPLDGLPMATRCGSLDASAVLYMIAHLKLTTNEVADILNKQSGLLGLSGISGDVRVLMESDNENAQFALDFYVHKICQELGAMIATLAGLDALIFTGGIGANNSLIRERVCKQFDWLGLLLEASNNQQNTNIISSTSSRIKVYSLKTDEELMMAQLVLS